MPCWGNVRRRAHIVGRIGGFGKFRGIREGRALPARLICKPGGLLTWLTGYIYVPGHGYTLKSTPEVLNSLSPHTSPNP
ncbi:MAG: hypothetical protein HDT08_00165 [Bacteroidales bacterium]|nr:hypothetical protein [Bacteroidales bacterium]